jgi:putative DNA primase/helicase
MAEIHQCKHCGTEITGQGDVCCKCIDNQERQEFFEIMSKPMLTYFVCPNDGELLITIEEDDQGNPTLYFCHKCRKKIDVSKALTEIYNPHRYNYNFFCDDPEKWVGFKPARVAKSIKDNYLFITDRRSKILYYYDVEKGMWSADGETYLQELVASSLGVDNRETHLRNILFHLKSTTLRDIDFKSKWLACRNCLLHPEKIKTKPLNPNEFVSVQIPHEFDPEAKCPAILKVLTEIVGESQLAVLQESIGNVFLKGHPFHKITIFIGEGGNGKGQTLELITQLVGKENVSNVTLQALCNDKFERAKCHLKLVNLGRDIPQSRISSTGNAKMMSGDDTLTMQHKFGHPFDATPDTLPKQFYSCNRLPPSDDDTDAWWRRQNLIVFNKKFIAGVDAIPQIATKLAESEIEMSGFLNWAFEGTQRLLKNKCFSANENTEENREKYIRSSNPAQAYIESNLIHEQGKFIIEKELWSKIGSWCEDNNIPIPRSKGAFTKELTKRMPHVIQTTVRVGGRVTHVYMNLTYKEPDLTKPTLENVSGVSGVTTSSIFSCTGESPEIKKKIPEVVTSVTTVTNGAFQNQFFICGDCGKKLGVNDFFTGNDSKKRCSDCNMNFMLSRKVPRGET